MFVSPEIYAMIPHTESPLPVAQRSQKFKTECWSRFNIDYFKTTTTIGQNAVRVKGNEELGRTGEEGARPRPIFRGTITASAWKQLWKTASSVKCLTFPENMSIPELDAYEKIRSMEFSLKTICAVNVVHRILDSAGMKRKWYWHFEATNRKTCINVEAAKRVEKLKLPTRLKELLAQFIMPVSHELHDWHNKYVFEICPTWAPHGTLDWVRSTRTLVDDPNLETSYRFKVACTFCHERQIFELARQMTEDEVAGIVDLPHRAGYLSLYEKDRDFGDPSRFHLWLPYTDFWFSVYRGGGLGLPQEACRGLSLALDEANAVAATYFLGKGDPEGIRSILLERFEAGKLEFWRFKLPPAARCLLFSKITDPDSRRSMFHYFVLTLLESLSSWPYRPLFLDVASSFCVHASDVTLIRLLESIVLEAAGDLEDFDYLVLFVGLCEIIYSLEPGFSMAMDYDRGMAIAKGALLTGDEAFINFVFGKFSEREKENLLLVDRCCAFEVLKPHLLKPFVRLCCGNGIDSLLKLRDAWKLPDWRGDFLHAEVQRSISRIVHELIAERERADGNIRDPASRSFFSLPFFVETARNLLVLLADVLRTIVRGLP